MKVKLFYAGAVSLGIGAFFTFLDLATIKLTFNGAFLVNVNIYPAVFFGLSGLALMYYGLRPLWWNRPRENKGEGDEDV